ncbi:hypothetical protein T11_15552 [Trichinella zimbabwensis]|uniref:Uncharacterized protein n=1 Tax=Trichinella zimbabwensis TaxID=268475 RepID=A0A0V1H2L6_9BILA|nr:hypothetical protein T11_15552 [Trichinella zimbabwensis]
MSFISSFNHFKLIPNQPAIAIIKRLRLGLMKLCIMELSMRGLAHKDMGELFNNRNQTDFIATRYIQLKATPTMPASICADDEEKTDKALLIYAQGRLLINSPALLRRKPYSMQLNTFTVNDTCIIQYVCPTCNGKIFVQPAADATIELDSVTIA